MTSISLILHPADVGPAPAVHAAPEAPVPAVFLLVPAAIILQYRTIANDTARAALGSHEPVDERDTREHAHQQ